jgi:hypothetical protein
MKILKLLLLIGALLMLVGATLMILNRLESINNIILYSGVGIVVFSNILIVQKKNKG